eukprot:443887_1
MTLNEELVNGWTWIYMLAGVINACLQIVSFIVFYWVPCINCMCPSKNNNQDVSDVSDMELEPIAGNNSDTEQSDSNEIKVLKNKSRKCWKTITVLYILKFLSIGLFGLWFHLNLLFTYRLGDATVNEEKQLQLVKMCNIAQPIWAVFQIIFLCLFYFNGYYHLSRNNKIAFILEIFQLIMLGYVICYRHIKGVQYFYDYYQTE